MGWYIARRLAAALVTVWIVATAGFLLVEIIPGDPARQLAGPGASAETLANIRAAYGFDDAIKALHGQDRRLNRETPCWFFIKARNIKVAVRGQRQCARDGRGRHD